ncbi:hypothetical protein BGZ97_012255 [Linnemannia gamsii]|uniref:Uncharacterized protein n=1 Tax=Linnemannia gamsii TaxID=64522 RepID=A0A9P6R228_9FUNG|nr:hypothetical protein BGZ97_012255 [Linnemannia gamsii]
MSDRSNVRKVGLVKSTEDSPPGRFVSSGTNVECNCACTPGYKVICRKGFGTVELSEDRLMCPVCYTSDELVPVTVGFMECQYRFFGIKETGEQFTSEWTEVAKEDAYQQFLPDKQTTWKRLIIESADMHDSDKCTGKGQKSDT